MLTPAAESDSSEQIDIEKLKDNESWEEEKKEEVKE